jgi:hypothetical protein
MCSNQSVNEKATATVSVEPKVIREEKSWLYIYIRNFQNCLRRANGIGSRRPTGAPVAGLGHIAPERALASRPG